MSMASDVIEGLQWIYENKDIYNIKVVNISLNSSVAESYQVSPLDAAAEILWFNGIVVVVSAGNNGTATLYPPANDPFVITVGAADDKGTQSLNDDDVASFSAFGTTEDGFAKPDLVAPGRNIISLLASTTSNVYVYHPANRVNDLLFRMSGTSMSAPMVSGAVALLLQDEPGLTPDQVKYRLTTTANKNWPAYNAVNAGQGYLDIYAAVHGTTTQSANTGLTPSQLLSTGSNPITWGSVGWNSVGWNSVGWNSVGWNSVGWNSVGWNSVGWNSVGWNSDFWGD
jgi:serine protease AprX